MLNSQHGIFFNNVNDSIVEGNFVYSNSNGPSVWDGIGISGDSNNNLIAHNKVYGVNQLYGTDIASSGCDDNIVRGNDFRGNATGGINDLGTGTIFDGNITGLTNDLASAATITIPPDHSFINVTGTTNIGTIADSWTGREITLKFAGVLRVDFSSSNQLGNNGLDWKTTANDSMNCVFDSATWVCDVSSSGLYSTFTWDPGDLADGAGETSGSITVTGAALGDYVLIAPPYDLQDLILTGYIQASDTAEGRLQNENAGANVDLASGTWNITVIRP
jgi:hypothetical protein